MIVGSRIHSDGSIGPDVPDDFRGTTTRLADGTYEATPEVTDRLAAVERTLVAKAIATETELTQARTVEATKLDTVTRRTVTS